MEINRRDFLSVCLWSTAWPAGYSKVFAANPRNIYLSCRKHNEDQYRATGFSVYGEKIFDTALPQRGHSFAVHPSKTRAVVFSRRPGNFAFAFNLISGEIQQKFKTLDSRHYYGHGFFCRRGKLLYATENDFQGERGVIGVYDAENNFGRIGELDSFGIGPHEIALLSDNRTLVVANGGILTNPEMPRIKLNVPEMSPSLSYVDRHTGECLKSIQLDQELHQLSIRHLAVGKDDAVAVAMQYEGPMGDLVPLIALHNLRDSANARNHEFALLDIPVKVLRAMKQYCGSICFDSSGTIIAVSAPRGNLITFWDIQSAKALSSVTVIDGSGIASGATVGTFIASSGQGEIFMVNPKLNTVHKILTDGFGRNRWDNHIVST